MSSGAEATQLVRGERAELRLRLSLELIAKNDRRTQRLDLSRNEAFRARSSELVVSLASLLQRNTALTLLDLSSCNIDDTGLECLASSLC